MLFSGLLFVLFVKLLVVFEKLKYSHLFYIHTIQLTSRALKPHPFFCVLPSLQFEKLKHFPILLLLD